MNPPLRHFRVEAGPGDATTVWMDVADRSVNVFSEDVLTELNVVISRLESGDDSGPVLIRSAKAKGFAAGADLKRILALQTAEEVEKFLIEGQQTFDRLERLTRPTIAVITGACLGGGLEFALACRHRIAIEAPPDQPGATATRLGLPETTLGLIPAWGGTQRLPRLVGLATALDMMLSGQSVNVADALRIGLIDGVVARTDADRDLEPLIRSIMGDSPRHSRSDADAEADLADGEPAQHAVLQAIRAGWPDDVQAGLAAEREQFRQLVFSQDTRQRIERLFNRKQA